MQNTHTHTLKFSRFVMGTMTAFGLLMSQAHSAAEATNHEALPESASYMYGDWERLTFDGLVQKAYPTEKDLGRELTFSESFEKELHYGSVKEVFKFTRSDASAKFSPILNKELANDYNKIGGEFVSTLHSLGLMQHIETYNGVSLLSLLQIAHNQALSKNYFKLDTEPQSDATCLVFTFKTTIEPSDYDRIEASFAQWTSYVLDAINASFKSDSSRSDGSEPDQGDALLMLISSSNRLADYDEALKKQEFQRWLAECEHLRKLEAAALLSNTEEETTFRVSKARRHTTKKSYNYR